LSYIPILAPHTHTKQQQTNTPHATTTTNKHTHATHTHTYHHHAPLRENSPSSAQSHAQTPSTPGTEVQRNYHHTRVRPQRK